MPKKKSVPTRKSESQAHLSVSKDLIQEAEQDYEETRSLGQDSFDQSDPSLKCTELLAPKAANQIQQQNVGDIENSANAQSKMLQSSGGVPNSKTPKLVP